MARATKKGDGYGNEEEHGQWLPQRGWRAFDGGNDGVGAKDTAACATIGERGMMVSMGHGLCVCFGVCGETTKNKKEIKIHTNNFLPISSPIAKNPAYCYTGAPGVAIRRIFSNGATYREEIVSVAKL
jgi:hypothetical protein